MKADNDFTINSFSGEETLEKYRKAVFDIGLWESEKIIFEKYMDKNAKVLDIGCGAGRTTFGLYKLGFRNLVGVDITPGMIESAKAIQSETNTDIRFEVGDACNLEFADETFDHCIFSFNGFMQIPSRKNRKKARMLMDYVVNFVRSNNGSVLSIGIINENEVLKKWYNDYGFKETGCKRFAHLLFTVCFMEKEIIDE